MDRSANGWYIRGRTSAGGCCRCEAARNLAERVRSLILWGRSGWILARERGGGELVLCRAEIRIPKLYAVQAPYTEYRVNLQCGHRRVSTTVTCRFSFPLANMKSFLASAKYG